MNREIIVFGKVSYMKKRKGKQGDEMSGNDEIKEGEELTVDYQKSLQNTNITYNHQY